MYDSEVCNGTTDFSVSDTLLGTYNFSCVEGFFLQFINLRVSPRRKKTKIWLKVGILTPSENLNCHFFSKSLYTTEIMVVVNSFHHNRHSFIFQSIQKCTDSGKMGHFELWAFKVWSKSYVVWTWPKYGQGNHHIIFFCPNTVHLHYNTPKPIMTHIYTYKWPIYI